MNNIEENIRKAATEFILSKSYGLGKIQENNTENNKNDIKDT